MDFKKIKKNLEQVDTQNLFQEVAGIFQAAVLVPLVEVNGEYHLLFEKRAADIRQGGEISFPGGGIEKEDISFEAAAIRETCEELTVKASDIEILGKLRPHVIPTGVLVYPFVGLLKVDVNQLQPSKDEVDYLFTVPLTYFLKEKPQVYSTQLMVHPEKVNLETGKTEITFPAKKLHLPEKFQKPWGNVPRTIYAYEYQKETIWGLTAEIIVTLMEKLQ